MIDSVSAKPDSPLILEFTDSEWKSIDTMLQFLKAEEKRTKKKGLNQFDPSKIEKVRTKIMNRERNFLEVSPNEFVILSDAGYDTKSRYPNKDSEPMKSAQEKLHTIDNELDVNLDKRINTILNEISSSPPTPHYPQ